jgi:hypothetical protein
MVIINNPYTHVSLTHTLPFTQPSLLGAPAVQVAVEYHKRFDPIYSDARNRIRQLGPFSYYYR